MINIPIRRERESIRKERKRKIGMIKIKRPLKARGQSRYICRRGVRLVFMLYLK